jgi:hypothetical protein
MAGEVAERSGTRSDVNKVYPPDRNGERYCSGHKDWHPVAAFRPSYKDSLQRSCALYWAEATKRRREIKRRSV